MARAALLVQRQVGMEDSVELVILFQLDRMDPADASA